MPVALVPAVPGLPVVDGLLASRGEDGKAKSKERYASCLHSHTEFPGRPILISRVANLTRSRRREQTKLVHEACGRPPQERRGPADGLLAADGGYLPTNVVTVVAASAAVKLPPLTATAVFETRLSVDDVTVGVIMAGAVPPAIVIGTLTAAVPLLTATTTTVPSVPL